MLVRAPRPIPPPASGSHLRPHPECPDSPCLNGGTCHLILATGATVCACPPGRAGRLCGIGEWGGHRAGWWYGRAAGRADPRAPAEPAQRCIVGAGTDYRGVAGTAASGLPCLAWNSDLLYQELHVDTVDAAALLGLGPHAYCR